MKTRYLVPLVAIAALSLPASLVFATGFDILAYNLNGGGGSNDNDINTAAEAKTIWDHLDGTPGDQVVNLGPIYNIEDHGILPTHLHTSTVNFGGGGGNFGGTSAYPLGPPGGDDFSVRAKTSLTLPAGTYSVAIASDDGRSLSLSGVAFSSVGGQGGTTGAGTDTVAFNGTTGHSQSIGVFTVGGGGITTSLDAFFFERGGGDSFEISIKSGSDTSFGGSGEGWELLADGGLGGAVSLNSGNTTLDTSKILAKTPGFNTQAYNVIGGGGSTDNDLNNTTEAKAIWDHLDGTPGAQVAVVGATTYNIAQHESGMSTEIDFAGGGGNFPTNNPYSDVGAFVAPADDFSVRAQAFVGIPEGQWTIAVASDDGRRLSLDGISFVRANDQNNIGGAGMDFIGLEGTSGHNQSVGWFTVPVGSTDTGWFLSELDAFFWERGGGDSFEISIAPGHISDFGQGNFVLLADEQFGWIVSKTAIELATTPEPSTFTLIALGLMSLGMVRRRRRR